MTDSRPLKFDVSNVRRNPKPRRLPAKRPSGGSPPVLDEAAMVGLAGRVVRTIEPCTEASRPALLADFLTTFGAAVGPGPHMYADAARHQLKLFSVIVGATSRARKGTSRSNMKLLFDLADPEWSAECVTSGMSSGEGLVQALADTDLRRLLLVESEFGRVLTVAERRGSTTSDYFRQLWDGVRLSILNRKRLDVDEAFLSVIGHITAAELREKLGHVDMSNGFANRVLWVYSERAQLIPDGSSVPPGDLGSLAEDVRHALAKARDIGKMRRNANADELWETAYVEADNDDLPGLLGAVTGRAEAQMLRLSMVYAALDGTATIKPKHVKAAWALWRYCRDSAAHVFAGSTGDAVADKIMAALESAEGQQLTRSDISRSVLKNNVPSEQLDRALALLTARRSVRGDREQSGPGRPREVISLASRSPVSPSPKSSVTDGKTGEPAP